MLRRTMGAHAPAPHKQNQRFTAAIVLLGVVVDGDFERLSSFTTLRNELKAFNIQGAR
jgi:hypothetical protein